MTNLLISSVGGTVLSVLLAILILLAMICVHEFGHFISGRILGFRINEFAIGFGPKIFKYRGKKHGTLFSVRAFPLGGFCAFQGEDGEEADPNSFNNKKPWQRIIVLVSGALFNYLLALLLIIVGFFSFGQPCYKMGAMVENESYAAEYSLQEGDVILGVQGKNVYFATDLIVALKGKSEGDAVTFDIVRGGEKSSAQVVLRADCNFKNSSEISKLWRALGSDTYEGDDGNLYWCVTAENCRFSFFQTLGRSFAYSFKTMGTIFRVLGELLTGNMGLSAMGGPVTTIRQTGAIAVQGVQSFLQVAAYIGVNLAVFNLLPIPALDGSKVVFCLIEWVFKKPVPRKVEAIIHAIGFVLILGFAVLVDIMQFARC
ncbi:MAG: site-2 protease family protein [Clostridiales bacterium]|nr:site-2 protease family protein [Clostridiales bacterium]